MTRVAAAQIPQLDTPQASKESHNSIHNHYYCCCRCCCCHYYRLSVWVIRTFRRVRPWCPNTLSHRPAFPVQQNATEPTTVNNTNKGCRISRSRNHSGWARSWNCTDFRSLSSFKRTINIMLLWIYLHDTDVLCGFIICIVNLFICSLCIFVVIVILLMWCVSGRRPFITNKYIL